MKKYFVLILLSTYFILKPNNSSALIKNKFLGDPKCATHIFTLIAAVINTDGAVLEMGCGDWSTPLLHILCSVKKRYLLSTETNKKWMETFTYLATPWHEFKYLPVYQDDEDLNPDPKLWDQIGANQHWSVVFIDHKPALRRAIDIQRLRNNADIIVAHDTEPESNYYYNYEAVLSTFKYRYIDDIYRPHTTIVSDSIDVSKFFN